MYMVAGTQAASAKRNYLALIKLSDIKQGRHGVIAGAADDSDDDLLSESDDEVEEPPQMHLRMQVIINPCDSSQQDLCSAPPSHACSGGCWCTRCMQELLRAAVLSVELAAVTCQAGADHPPLCMPSILCCRRGQQWCQNSRTL